MLLLESDGPCMNPFTGAGPNGGAHKSASAAGTTWIFIIICCFYVASYDNALLYDTMSQDPCPAITNVSKLDANIYNRKKFSKVQNFLSFKVEPNNI